MKVVTVGAKRKSGHAWWQYNLSVQTSLKFLRELVQTATVFSGILKFLYDLQPFLVGPEDCDGISF